jgi:hypothetical protein
VKADKGNTIITLDNTEYQRMIDELISNNNFSLITKVISILFKQRIRKNLNCNNIIIPKVYKWKYINLNLTPPSITGLIKIHEQDTPIRWWVDGCMRE